MKNLVKNVERICMAETMKGGDGPQEPAAMRRVHNQAQQSKPIPMPAGVKYMVWTEFFMRFSLKGIQTVLPLFLFEYLLLSENVSTDLVHVFITIVCLFPVVGALLSDGYLGKYHTYLSFALLQFAGMAILILTAIPGQEMIGSRIMLLSFTALGLLAAAMGNGGLTPCSTAFGGDQIEELIAKGADRERLMGLFFSQYYLTRSAGSFVSTVAVPAIRTVSSYFLIFSVQFAFTGFGLLVFWLGGRHYIHRPVKENIFVKVFTIIGDAIRFQIKCQGQLIMRSEQEHFLLEEEIGGNDPKTSCRSEGKYRWLDGAKRNHDATAVEDVKGLLRALVLFIPIPVFWSLYYQQSSKWVFQARSLNCEVQWLGGLIVQPDQMQALNPILILIMIPLFDRAIYPLCAKLNIPLPPLRRMVIGMVMGTLAFLASGSLQLFMDKTLTSTSIGVSIGGEYSISDVHLNLMSGARTLIDFQVASAPAKLSVLWQVPQFVFITAGEVLINVTGLEFAYEQAPNSMKSVLQSAWNCTAATGNLLTFGIAAILAERVSKANELFIFAGGCAAATLLLIWISYDYSNSSTIVASYPDPVLEDNAMTV